MTPRTPLGTCAYNPYKLHNPVAINMCRYCHLDLQILLSAIFTYLSSNLTNDKVTQRCSRSMFMIPCKRRMNSSFISNRLVYKHIYFKICDSYHNQIYILGLLYTTDQNVYIFNLQMPVHYLVNVVTTQMNRLSVIHAHLDMI